MVFALRPLGALKCNGLPLYVVAVTAALFYHTCSRMLKGCCSRCWWRHFFFFFFSFCSSVSCGQVLLQNIYGTNMYPICKLKTGSCRFLEKCGLQKSIVESQVTRSGWQGPVEGITFSASSRENNNHITQRSRRHRQLYDITTLNPQIKSPESNQL